jgi:hypothetical protein
VQMSTSRQKIVGALQMAKDPMGPKDISNATGLTQNVVKQRLIGMLSAGEVIQVARGLYTHPANARTPPVTP